MIDITILRKEHRMEFHKKLQELRARKGLTQEEIAAALFVSRTAVSKWESGRGYPNVDSLRAIAKFYDITLDELLSSDQLLSIAEADNKQRGNHFCDLVLGLLDTCALLLLFLPFFVTKAGVAASLFTLTEVQVYMKVLYLVTVFTTGTLGILTLALQNTRATLWLKFKHSLSLFLGSSATLLFIISSQVYSAAFLFVFFIIKTAMLIKIR